MRRRCGWSEGKPPPTSQHAAPRPPHPSRSTIIPVRGVFVCTKGHRTPWFRGEDRQGGRAPLLPLQPHFQLPSLVVHPRRLRAQGAPPPGGGYYAFPFQLALWSQGWQVGGWHQREPRFPPASRPLQFASWLRTVYPAGISTDPSHSACAGRVAVAEPRTQANPRLKQANSASEHPGRSA